MADIERPDWVRDKLVKLAGQTVSLLHELTDVRGPAVPVVAEVLAPVWGGGQPVEQVLRIGAMPCSAVAHAQALAFIFRRKVGVLVSVMREKCLLLTKLEHEDGSVSWSAPLFLRGRTVSAGITAGWLDMRVCWAIEGEAGVWDFLKPQHLLGINAAWLIDMNGGHLRALRPTSGSEIEPKGDGVVAKYYRFEAFMVDLSVRGGNFRIDSKLNQAAYGMGATTEAILSGQVAPPCEFQPVYRLLAELLHSVPAVQMPGVHRMVSALRLASVARGLHSHSPGSELGAGSQLGRRQLGAGGIAEAAEEHEEDGGSASGSSRESSQHGGGGPTSSQSNRSVRSSSDAAVSPFEAAMAREEALARAASHGSQPVPAGPW